MNDISPGAANARESARQTDGKFGEQAKDTATDQPLPSPAFGNDLAMLTDERGRFENGYDSADISQFAARFESVDFGVVWDEYSTSDGYIGDSEFVVRERPDGKWMRLHADASAFLICPDEAPADLSHLTSLASDQPAYEVSGAIMHDEVNFASRSDDICRADGCFEDLDDGNGWDGWCGHHADIVSGHEDGDHKSAPRDDCPECY